MHLQRALTSEETVEAKQPFEAFTVTHGVTIKHYHADNGRFQDKLFHQVIHEERQTLSFCGINAHFQNRVAEKRIRDLQDNARSMLVHAQRRWEDAVTINLWPYALRVANNIHNSTPHINEKQSPLE